MSLTALYALTWARAPARSAPPGSGCADPTVRGLLPEPAGWAGSAVPCPACTAVRGASLRPSGNDAGGEPAPIPVPQRLRRRWYPSRFKAAAVCLRGLRSRSRLPGFSVGTPLEGAGDGGGGGGVCVGGCYRALEPGPHRGPWGWPWGHRQAARGTRAAPAPAPLRPPGVRLPAARAGRREAARPASAGGAGAGGQGAAGEVRPAGESGRPTPAGKGGGSPPPPPPPRPGAAGGGGGGPRRLLPPPELQPVRAGTGRGRGPAPPRRAGDAGLPRLAGSGSCSPPAPPPPTTPPPTPQGRPLLPARGAGNGDGAGAASGGPGLRPRRGEPRAVRVGRRRAAGEGSEGAGPEGAAGGRPGGSRPVSRVCRLVPSRGRRRRRPGRPGSPAGGLAGLSRPRVSVRGRAGGPEGPVQCPGFGKRSRLGTCRRPRVPAGAAASLTVPTGVHLGVGCGYLPVSLAGPCWHLRGSQGRRGGGHRLTAAGAHRHRCVPVAGARRRLGGRGCPGAGRRGETLSRRVRGVGLARATFGGASARSRALPVEAGLEVEGVNV